MSLGRFQLNWTRIQQYNERKQYSYFKIIFRGEKSISHCILMLHLNKLKKTIKQEGQHP